MRLDLHLGWDHLSEDRPLDQRSLVAGDELAKHLLIGFAQLGDPEPAVRPGQDPELYSQASTPVAFSRYTSQAIIAGMRETAGSGQPGLMPLAAGKILEGLDIR